MATPDTINVTQLSPAHRNTRSAGALSMFASTPITPPIHACCRRASGAITAPYRPGRTNMLANPSSSICQRGQKLSQGVAAWLRHAGARAESLEGGFEAWVKAEACWCAPIMCQNGITRGAPSGSRARGRRSIASPAHG